MTVTWLRVNLTDIARVQDISLVVVTYSWLNRLSPPHTPHTHIHTKVGVSEDFRMAWLPDGEKKFEDIFIRFGATHERDRQTDTA